jgi:hypothetical protein
MPTKQRKDMWEPIKGWVICQGYKTCSSKRACLHSRLHRWRRSPKFKEGIDCCYNSDSSKQNTCNCSHKTKTELMLEAY